MCWLAIGPPLAFKLTDRGGYINFKIKNANVRTSNALIFRLFGLLPVPKTLCSVVKCRGRSIKSKFKGLA